MTLTLSYRPVTFADVVGQKHIRPFLREMVKTEKVPPALIFGGPRGTGKTTSARILAAALNCEQERTGDACGECKSCLAVQQANSVTVLEIDAASNGGVDEMRSIKDLCLYSHTGRWRVILLDEAHSMSKEAFHSLLKLLEEPPPNTLFILLTTEVDKILDTVQSRAMRFDFRRISPADIFGRLKQIAEKEEIKAEDALLLEIANRSQGGLRDAVMTLGQIDLMGIQTVDGYNELQGVSDVSEDLLKAAIRGDLIGGSRIIEQQFRRTGDAVEMTSQLVLLVRDLLILKAGGTPDASKEQIDSRKLLAGEVDQIALTRTIAVLWDLRNRVKALDFDQRASMEMAFVLITEALKTRAQAAPMPQKAAAPRAPEPVQQKVDIGTLRGLLAG
jgi:DNA polymerase-3 subunit gamma/tau